METTDIVQWVNDICAFIIATRRAKFSFQVSKLSTDIVHLQFKSSILVFCYMSEKVQESERR